jgi:hypothetical protein
MRMPRRPAHQFDNCLNCEAVPEPFCSCREREISAPTWDRAAVKVLNDTGRNPHALVVVWLQAARDYVVRGGRAPGSNLRETEGHRFESCRDRQPKASLQVAAIAVKELTAVQPVRREPGLQRTA